MTFARTTPEERREQRAAERSANLRALATATLRPVSAGSYSGETGCAAPKREYVRSESLMRAYRLIPCQNCGASDGTVCGAHSNWAIHGKGRGIKADDNRCASLCFTCHGVLDQGSELSGAERAALWWCAHAKTVKELMARGLWPKGVPVPQLEDLRP